LPISMAGYEAHMMLARSLGLSPERALKESFEVEDYQLVLVPSMSNPRPIRSVGLGDTFTSGFLVCTPSTRP